jgi:hypothetical protein
LLRFRHVKLLKVFLEDSSYLLKFLLVELSS